MTNAPLESPPLERAAREHPRLRVLVVDDDKNIRTTLTICLGGFGCEVAAAPTGQGAMNQIEHLSFDAAFVDLKIGGDSGLDLIPRLLGENPNLTIVLMTAYATVETAVEAIRRGAWDYLQKPFTPAQIQHILDRVVTERALWRRVADLERRIDDTAADAQLSTDSPAMRAVLDTVSRAATVDVAVLFRGESGTGKGLLARLLHDQSSRRDLPFVVTNCPTLSEELIASELFGNARGSFTGAVRDQIGRVEAAEGGTVFLDEIGEIPSSTQAKLLRFLQDHDFERVGENRTRHADVRVIAATNRDLDADIAAGRFREDLYFRLSGATLHLPPLRQRLRELPLLAASFLDDACRRNGRAMMAISDGAMTALLAYSWPGNVRELKNLMQYVAAAHQSDALTADHVAERLSRNPRPTGRITPLVTAPSQFRPLADELRELEITRIREALDATGGNQTRAAGLLAMPVRTFFEKAKQHGLTPKKKREGDA